MAMRWLQKTHLLRPDEYICPACGERVTMRKNGLVCVATMQVLIYPKY